MSAASCVLEETVDAARVSVGRRRVCPRRNQRGVGGDADVGFVSFVGRRGLSWSDMAAEEAEKISLTVKRMSRSEIFPW